MFCRMIVRERAFGPCGGRAFGPSRSGARNATRLQNIQSEIPTKIHFPGGSKNGGKIWIFWDRHKRYFERVEKVHFWKIQFQNLFQKSKNSNFAAIFIYIEYINGSRIVVKRYYKM